MVQSKQLIEDFVSSILQTGSPTMSANAAITLPKELTIRHAETLYTLLGRDLGTQQRDRVTLDAAQVEQVDCAGLQTLAVFVQALRQKDIEVDWQNLPDALSDAASLLDMHTLLFTRPSV